MSTLRAPRPADLPEEDRAALERISRRLGLPIDKLLERGIFGVQSHWPGWLEANLDHSLATYMWRGTLAPIEKEAMHVAVSMTNKCDY